MRFLPATRRAQRGVPRPPKRVLCLALLVAKYGSAAAALPLPVLPAPPSLASPQLKPAPSRQQETDPEQEPASTAEPAASSEEVLLRPPPSPSPRRSRRASAGIVGGLYGALTVWAYFAWYYNQPNIDFTLGGDGLFGSTTYAGGADKLGHFWANNVFTRISTEILARGGWSRLPAAVVAGGLTLSFFTFIEVKDGFYYSFSYGDEAANTLGTAFAIAAANIPALDEAIDFRVDYSPSAEYWSALTHRGDVNIAEDYSGQTYHLAFHLGCLSVLSRSSRAFRYMDVLAAFRATNYKPEPAKAIPREQELFFGLGFNLQGVLTDWLGRKSNGAAAGQLATEFFSLPYSTLRVIGAGRSPDDS